MSSKPAIEAIAVDDPEQLFARSLGRGEDPLAERRDPRSALRRELDDAEDHRGLTVL